MKTAQAKLSKEREKVLGDAQQSFHVLPEPQKVPQARRKERERERWLSIQCGVCSTLGDRRRSPILYPSERERLRDQRLSGFMLK